MTDAEYLFKTDCAEKKRIARSANNKNRFGKGPVKLPSDNLSKKEIRKMSGDVKNYNMNKPVPLRVFKTWPLDIQQQYLDKLKERFDPTYTDMALIFEVGETEIQNYVRYGQLKYVGSRRRKSLTNSNNQQWQEWALIDKKEDRSDPDIWPCLSNGSLTVTGTVNELHLPKLLKMLCNNKTYRFTIEFEEVDNEK